jgi:hypothetical protein
MQQVCSQRRDYRQTRALQGKNKWYGTHSKLGLSQANGGARNVGPPGKETSKITLVMFGHESSMFQQGLEDRV